MACRVMISGVERRHESRGEREASPFKAPIRQTELIRQFALFTVEGK